MEMLKREAATQAALDEAKNAQERQALSTMQQREQEERERERQEKLRLQKTAMAELDGMIG